MSAFTDLIVLLPGITGSVLTDIGGKDIWAPSISTIWRSITASATAINSLALTGGPEDDAVQATALVSDVTIVPGFVKIHGYTRIADYLVSELGLEPGANFHEFPYDWRRDNRLNASRLREQASAWLETWRATSGHRNARLVLIGHSMGGLVARYFFECLEGWRDTRLLLTLGTPHSGSLNALGFLEHGMKKSIGPLGIDLGPALRSMPSVYQLLPSYRCIAIDSGPLLHVHEAAAKGVLMHVDAARALDAKSFHAEIAAAAEANKAQEGYPEMSSVLVPFVGIDQPTFQSALLNASGLRLVERLDTEDSGGDGTVPRVSAVPPGWNEMRIVYAGETHGALQNADGTLVNLKGLLTAHNVDLRKFFSATMPASLSLRVDDVVAPGEMLEVRACRSGGDDEIFAEATQLGSGEKVSDRLYRDGDSGWQRGRFDLAPGLWQIRVHSKGAEPVHEIVVVAQ